jgi:hypothetical protein
MGRSPRHPSRLRAARTVLTVAACSAGLAAAAIASGGPAQATATHPSAPRSPHQAAAPHAGQSNSAFQAVSCPTGTSCLAVGAHTSAGGTTRTLAERWSGGRWSIVGSATPARAIDSELHAMSCVRPSSCQAVGFATPTGTGAARLLAERWNGRSWASVPIQNSPNASLEAVSCPRAGMCLTVGWRPSGPNQFQPVTERWNGTKWTKLATPRPAGRPFSELLGVSCAGPRDCTAVGQSGTINTGQFFALVEHWNGSRWRIVTVHAPRGALLNSVSCATATTCTAVGDSQPAHSDSKLLVGDLKGSRWTFTSPAVRAGMHAPAIAQVSCSTPRTCTAVVSFVTSRQLLGTVVASRGASGGFVIAAPNAKSTVNALMNVSCRPVACTVVGGTGATDRQGGPSGKGKTFAERGKGNHLVVQRTPSPAG